MPADHRALDGSGDSAQAGVDRLSLEGLPTIQNLGKREVLAAMMPPLRTPNECALGLVPAGGADFVLSTTLLPSCQKDRIDDLYHDHGARVHH